MENPANRTFASEGVRKATSALLQQVFAGVLQPRLQKEALTDSTSGAAAKPFQMRWARLGFRNARARLSGGDPALTALGPRSRRLISSD